MLAISTGQASAIGMMSTASSSSSVFVRFNCSLKGSEGEPRSYSSGSGVLAERFRGRVKARSIVQGAWRGGWRMELPTIEE